MGALFVFPQFIFGQQDTTKQKPAEGDTAVVGTPIALADGDTVFVLKTREHKPRVAVISSAILPGAGQAYNRKYWKIPIIYGTGSVLYYFYDYNQKTYERFREAYNQKSAGETPTDPDLKDMELSTLEFYRDNYRRNRDYNVIFMGLLYVANIVDAMVDAHMYKYDISRNLTMQIGPTILPTTPSTYTASAGLKIKLSF